MHIYLCIWQMHISKAIYVYLRCAFRICIHWVLKLWPLLYCEVPFMVLMLTNAGFRPNANNRVHTLYYLWEKWQNAQTNKVKFWQHQLMARRNQPTNNLPLHITNFTHHLNTSTDKWAILKSSQLDLTFASHVPITQVTSHTCRQTNLHIPSK